MEKSIIIVTILLERIIFAIVGLIATIYGQYLWSVFMAVMIILLAVGTKIKVK